MKKRILITGASGFIGGFLVKEALQRGYDVWAGIRPGSSRENLQDERIQFIHLKYDDKDALTAQLREVAATGGAWHYIIHNAGITKTLHMHEFYKVNVQYTHTLIESLSAAGCQPEKFLLMSSLSSYGPVNEYSSRPIRIDDKQQPDSIYGKSKLQAEMSLKAQTCFPYIILCPTGVYGPGDKEYLMELKSIKAGFVLKAGLKRQLITFVYVKDLAIAAFLALENPAVRNTMYFVTDGHAYTGNTFAGIAKKTIGKRLVIHLPVPLWLCYVVCVCSAWIGIIVHKPMTLNKDKYKILRQRNWVCETEKTNRELGFIPHYDLQEGLEETIRYYEERGWL